MHNRVKYYGPNNWGNVFGLQRTEDILNNFDISDICAYDINDIIEFYNIIKFFDNGMYLDNWSEETRKHLSSTAYKLKGIVGKYLHSICIENLSDLYENTDISYKTDFFSMLSKYKVTQKITPEQFSAFLEKEPNSLHLVLYEKNFVLKFGKVIVDQFASNIKSAEWIISHFFEQRDENSAKIYMPAEFSQDIGEQIIHSYINSDKANLNYLQLISGMKIAGDFPLNDKLRLSARRKAQKISEKISEQSTKGIEFGVEVDFADHEEICICDFGESKYIEKLTYSKKWIAENLDFPTLLNNFIFLFNYTDWHYRCRFLSNPNHLGVLEQHIGIHGNNEYSTGIEYRMTKIRSCLQMYRYRTELKAYGIEIEDIFKWFYEQYLKEEFGVENFYYFSPSVHSNYLEKMLLMASQFDAVLKQFRIFCEDMYIDRELFEMSSSAHRIVDTPSMIENKYLYPSSKKIKDQMLVLFSDQSSLKYIEKINKHYESFVDLICNESLKISDFPEYGHKTLQLLLDDNVIYINEFGFISIESALKSLLFDLFYNGSIAYSYCSGKRKILADKLLQSEDLEAEEKLFTRQEQAYLDYILNVQQFYNGPELRNKYVHGTFPTNPKSHESDYIEMLKIMTLIVIKINEEFCLKFPIK